MARRLHEGLEGYRVPRLLKDKLNRSGEKIPARLQPVFRDLNDLSAASNLTEALKDALRQSHSLVVLCTENSARSEWVAKEIEYFRELGRPHRIFCMIGPVRQPTNPGGTLPSATELFPTALRRTCADDSKMEPLAGDARPGQDGFRVALLKTIAGILDIDFDRLRQRERERRRRRVLLGCALVAGGVLLVATAYLAAVDAGLNLFGAAPLRATIDLHRWSVFRPIYSIGRINAAASAVRQELLAADQKHWRSEAGFPAGSDDRDPKSGIWASSQLACGVLHCPEAPGALVQTALKAIAAAFDPSQSMENKGRPLGWLASKNELHPSFEPTVWTCAALVAALGRRQAVAENQRDQFATWLSISQTSMDNFECTPGGYSSFAVATPGFAGSDYATALALGVMLNCRQYQLPWRGSQDRLDAKIRASVQFLCAHFDGAKRPPGWTLLADGKWNASPGLTLQILAELLRTHREIGIPLPAPIVQSAADWMEFAAKDSDIEDKDYFTQTFVEPSNQVAQADRTIGFLHQPWAIALAWEWREVAASLPDAQHQLALADRTLSYQIVDRSSETIQTGAKLPFYFSAEYFWTTTQVPNAQ